MCDYRKLYDTLLPLYDVYEARSIARQVMHEAFGIDLEGIIMGRDRFLQPADKARLAEMTRRLGNGEPVQYVLGRAALCGLTFAVDSHTLIPRPETGQLVELIKDSGISPTSILDIGTGSGCIAICLKKRFPASRVVAIDKSEGALRVARRNALRHKVRIEFRLADALSLPRDGEKFSLIVSNPPYVCSKEAAAMHRNVLYFEPHEALFVPDSDPLLFYRAITDYAAEALTADGQLWFEINPAYWRELQCLIEERNFRDVTIMEDFFHKKRFAHAYR